MAKFKIGIFWLSAVIFLMQPVQGFAGAWNQNRVLADRDLEDHRSMSVEDIQQFLMRRGVLGAYVTVDVDRKMKRAADIIARVAETYRLNPQFLLALMQKEQGIVEHPSPTEAQLAWAMGYSVCDRCDKDHPELQEYQGFANQLEQAAKRLREVYLPQLSAGGKTITGWAVGAPRYADGVKIVPENRATAALYTYTPHIAGNHLLWRIWQKWFSARYPDGTLLTSDYSRDDTVYLIQRGLKRPIVSGATLLSRFDPRKVITIPREELAGYNEGPSIRFPDYSVVRVPRGAVYLTVGDILRGFPSREIFRTLGFKEDEVVDVTWEELSGFTEGAPLAASAAYPRGALLQDSETGGVYEVREGKKYPIWSKVVLKARFPNRPIIRVSPEELTHYETGEPVRLADGELVGIEGGAGIYVIESGMRRPIPSAEIFLGMGWKWDRVVWVSEKVLLLHPEGAPIFLHAPPEVFMASS